MFVLFFVEVRGVELMPAQFRKSGLMYWCETQKKTIYPESGLHDSPARDRRILDLVGTHATNQVVRQEEPGDLGRSRVNAVGRGKHIPGPELLRAGGAHQAPAISAVMPPFQHVSEGGVANGAPAVWHGGESGKGIRRVCPLVFRLSNAEARDMPMCMVRYRDEAHNNKMIFAVHTAAPITPNKPSILWKGPFLARATDGKESLRGTPPSLESTVELPSQQAHAAKDLVCVGVSSPTPPRTLYS